MPDSQPSGRPFRSERFARTCSLIVVVAALFVFCGGRLAAQQSARVTGVDPASAKPNDTITIAGENLGKAQVAAVFLSDDKDDFKAVVVSQEPDKIVIKVPAVKPGSYNISIQSANAILIQPIKFTVE